MSHPEREGVRDFLIRRENELVAEITALHGELAPKEAELAEVRRAQGALGMLHPVMASIPLNLEIIASNPLSSTPIPPQQAIPSPSSWENNTWEVAAQVAVDRHRRNAAAIAAASFSQPPLPLISHYQRMTMKELVIRALTEHFPNGATAKQLREFFRDGWGRLIERNNLAPQITRLHKDGLIESLEGGKWRLAKNRLTLSPEALLAKDEPPSGDEPDDDPESPDVGK